METSVPQWRSGGEGKKVQRLWGGSKLYVAKSGQHRLYSYSEFIHL